MPKDHSRHIARTNVDQMRKDIEIDLVKDADSRMTAFNVYYTARDPIIAQQVTSKLTNLFINENLEVRQQQSEDTTKFLEDQLESARQTLGGAGRADAAIQGAHVGELPASVGKQSANSGRPAIQLQAAEDALNTAASSTSIYRAWWTSIAPCREYRRVRSRRYRPDQRGTATGQEKTDLRNMSAVYKEQYPEIRQAQRADRQDREAARPAIG